MEGGDLFWYYGESDRRWKRVSLVCLSTLSVLSGHSLKRKKKDFSDTRWARSSCSANKLYLDSYRRMGTGGRLRLRRISGWWSGEGKKEGRKSSDYAAYTIHATTCILFTWCRSRKPHLKEKKTAQLLFQREEREIIIVFNYLMMPY